MKLVYLGTPEMGVPPLVALHDAGHDVVLVVSNPDRRRGRGGATSPSPVKAAALELGLRVTDDLDALAGVDADLGVVVAYGRIIPVEVLERLPMVNLHFSLLPRWRGAAPVERAILAGDGRTGVCVMDVAEGLDTGAVHASTTVPIGERTTAAELRETLVAAGTELLVSTLAGGLEEPVPQDSEGVTYAAKLTSEDRRLDWDRPVAELDRVIRVGGAWTTCDGKRLKVLDAVPVPMPERAPVPNGVVVEGTVVTAEQGALLLRRVQPEGRAAMDARDWANGLRANQQRPDGLRLGT